MKIKNRTPCSHCGHQLYHHLACLCGSGRGPRQRGEDVQRIDYRYARHRLRGKKCLVLLGRKISETTFVSHEMRQLPVKRGAATVQVKFETIKQIDVK